MTDGGGRLAVVTASAAGIGLATAETLAGRGWRVVMSDLDAARGRSEAARLGAEFRPCDVRDEAQIEALFDGLGVVHVLVNNAGIAGPTAPLHEIAPAVWREVLDVNLTAQFLACRLVVPGMIAAGDGVIVNLSSVAGRIGYANRAPYGASKWGVIGLTKALAQEVGCHGVRVNAVLPGAVRGPRIEAVIAAHAKANRLPREESERFYLGRQASGRFVELAEVAGTIAFLCSDAARSITGQAVDVSGGFQ